MDYPVQTQRRKMLRYLFRKLREREVPGVTSWIELEFKKTTVLTVGEPGESIEEQLGLNAAQVERLLEQLRNEGYILGGGWNYFWHRYERITQITDKGLREIGELPDPHFELMQRLDLAILQIQQDQRLSEPQKRQTIPRSDRP